MRQLPSYLIDRIKEEVELGYIYRKRHPNEDLYIYNYTPKCQYEWRWNDATKACRGLILDSDNTIIARPFSKFFNIEEYGRMGGIVPDIPFKVYEKLDGSLSILYWIGDKPFLATRGSFDSDMAIHATDILYKRYSHTFDRLNRNKTYLFEVIYPDNRIVIDYGVTDDLFHIATINIETGWSAELEDVGFPVVERYDGLYLDTITSINEKNREGFVVHFENDLRVKVKFEEYKKLHKLYSSTSEKTIWEHLSSGIALDIHDAPLEFQNWAVNVSDNLVNRFSNIDRRCKKVYGNLNTSLTRKELAGIILRDHRDMAPILFSMLDGKKYDGIIWKMIRPAFMDTEANGL